MVEARNLAITSSPPLYLPFSRGAVILSEIAAWTSPRWGLGNFSARFPSLRTGLTSHNSVDDCPNRKRDVISFKVGRVTIYDCKYVTDMLHFIFKKHPMRILHPRID